MNALTVSRNKQRGAILMVLFFAVFAVGATVFLSSVNTHAVEIRRHQDVRAELNKAKQALIAYAMNYHTYGFDNDGDTFTDDEGPGRLICPDVDNDGLADTGSADCTDYVRGRLPQSFSYGGNTVNLNNAFADIGQQFWYVVSPAFKEIATTDVNHLTAGDLSIDGEAGYVAVIIAPGEALAGQDRSASQTSAANYLEDPNLITNTDFFNSNPDDPDAPFNDQVIGIKAAELHIEEVVELFTERPRQVLAAYYIANDDLPTTQNALSTYMENTGLRWFVDEGYMTSYSGYFYYEPYPYIRYNLNGCTSYWYWFIPVSPYSPDDTYETGTPC